MPPLAGRRDDRQPQIRACPQTLRFTVETLHHNHITAPMLTDSDSHRACAEPLGPRHQGRSSSLRCGRPPLTPGPVQGCPHRGRNKLKTPLTTPCPSRDDYLISASTVPWVTAAPASTARPVMVPSLCAVTGFSIFIASRTTTRSPADTSWPSSTATFTTVPCIGAVTASPEAAAPAWEPRLRGLGLFRTTPALSER